MNMVIGFTGTREGMTQAQTRRVADILSAAKVSEVHHGDCVGADAVFHILALERRLFIVVHPPVKATYRAHCQPAVGRGLVMSEADYLTRNRAIVEACDLLIAAPKETSQPLSVRGRGAWYTIRHARRSKTPTMIVWPRGSVEIWPIGFMHQLFSANETKGA
jgi:hypothetical protein